MRLGYISREAARRDYKVVLRDDGTLDADATAKARAGNAGMSDRGVIVGVDVGGTFTDLFLLDAANGRFRTAKVPSRRGDEAQGFLNGLNALGGRCLDQLDRARHHRRHQHPARTSRPKIGVITTRGFRDVLEMRRRDRRRTWGLWGDFIPIADRDMRVEVNERTLADGSIRTPVDPAEVRGGGEISFGQGRGEHRDHLHQCLRQCRQ